MEKFTERMLERTRRRQELLAAASSTDLPSKPLPSPTIETLLPVEHKTTPSRYPRRNRLAELASRVDMWLAEEITNRNEITNQNKAVDINGSSKEIDTKTTTASPLSQTKTTEEKLKIIENKSTLPQQQQKHQEKPGSIRNALPPQRQSLSLAASTLTVAQRRALFEQTIAAQQNVKKPISTTTVTISLTKTTTANAIDKTITTAIKDDKEKPTLNEEGGDKIVVDKEVTPPRSIPFSKTTPPSRRGTRPRMSPAIAATFLGNSSSQERRAWTPPCIKNVLLKKRLLDEMDDEQQKITEKSKDTVAVTSSPINTAVSPADRIAMSVGRVRFVPTSPSGSLYPDLSMIEKNNVNDQETITQIENPVTGCKRRSNGNSTFNTSTTSESLSEDTEDAELLGAKRSRGELKKIDARLVSVTEPPEKMLVSSSTIIQENSPLTPVTALKTTTPNHSSSLMSGHTTDNSLSQACTSFTFHRNIDNSHAFEDGYNSADLVMNSTENEKLHPIGLIDDDDFGDHLKPDKQISSNNGHNKPALVHTISTYRKQQQQLRLNSTPSSKAKHSEEEKYSKSALLQQRLKLFDDENDEDDDEEYKLQELEAAAERARHLERAVVLEQDRIIEQATQALNICDVYRQKNSLRPVLSNQFSPEHVHAERLLLIAGLRRTDAVREAQRLRVERTLLPGGILGERFRQMKIHGGSKTLVIESLRVPILSAVNCGGSNNIKNKYGANEGIENLTRWPGGYRYFVCAIRAVATVCRPPVTAASRPADAVEESVLRFSGDVNRHSEDGISYGYVEFITKKPVKSSSGRKCLMPPEAEGGPIMIHGLDSGGWKITVELYGLSPTATGDLEHNSGSSGKPDGPDVHENSKSVLDKLWSTVTTPSKESKKHHSATLATCIESPGGPMAVRNTVFRQLGYFVFSDGQVNRQQFTLNKVHQSSNCASTSKVTTNNMDETVRVRMRLLEDGEQYTYDDNNGDLDLDHPSLGKPKNGSRSGCSMITTKPLKLPSECKQTEGFLTLFDDHELRATTRGPQWQRHSKIDGAFGGTTLWRRLWFRIEVIDCSEQQESRKNSDDEKPKQRKTIVLRYWMYPEHAEQKRESLGVIDLSRCLPSKSYKTETTDAISNTQQFFPASPAHSDVCARPNTLQLQFHISSTHDVGHGDSIIDGIDDSLLLAADTGDERREWCDTINAAVRAISEDREQFKIVEAAHVKQKQQQNEKDQEKRRQQEQQRTSVWSATGGSGKSYGKKKKFYK